MNEIKQKSSNGLIIAGYICSFFALIILPIPLGIAGLIIGIVNLTKGSVGNGIAQIILSVTCGLFGTIIGAMIGSGM